MAGFNPWTGMQGPPQVDENGWPIMPVQGLPMGPPRSAMSAQLPQEEVGALPQSVGRTAGTPPFGNPASGGDNTSAADPNQALYDEINARQLDSLRRQQAGVEQGERQLGAYAKIPQQLDLSPLMALSDAWFGGQSAKSYKAPTSGEDRVATLANLQNAVQRQRGGVTDADLSLLQSKLRQSQNADEMKMRLRELEARRAERKLGERQLDSYKTEKQEQQVRTELFKLAKPVQGAIKLNRALTGMQDFIRKNGIPIIDAPNRREFDTRYQAVKLGVKDAEDLGPLTSSDVNITAGTIGPETSVEAFIDSLKGQKPEDVVNSLQITKDGNKAQFGNMMGSLKATFPTDVAKPQFDNWETQYGKAECGAAPGMTREQKIEELRKRGKL